MLKKMLLFGFLSVLVLMVACVTLIAIFVEEPSANIEEQTSTHMEEIGEAKSLSEYSLTEPQIFEPTQGQKHFYTVYVPEEMAGSDRELYAIAVKEYPGRGKEVNASFFTDIEEAAASACFDKPNEADFMPPCNGKFDGEYPSHWGFIHLTEESRLLYKTFLNRTALDSDLSGWDLEEPVSEPRVRGSIVSSVPVWTVDYSVTISTEAEATMQRLCTDAHFLYKSESQRDVTSRRDAINVHFLIGERAENARWLKDSPLERRPITKISFRPYQVSKDVDQAHWSLRVNGDWDEGSSTLTCQGKTK